VERRLPEQPLIGRDLPTNEDVDGFKIASAELA
jgi:hypothetical protein